MTAKARSTGWRGVWGNGVGSVLISSYERRVTERTHIWMIVSFLYHCLQCAPALGFGAQVLPRGLEPAELGLQQGRQPRRT